MLIVSGLEKSLSDAHSDLVTLKSRVDECVRAFSFHEQTTAVVCARQVGGSPNDVGLPTFEKSSFLDQADNVIMFDVARTILTNWRNTGTGETVNTVENNVRRIAAQKLGEEAVLEGGPAAQATQTLASAGRIETNDAVKLAIIASLRHLLSTRGDNIIPSSVRTEALTTLRLFSDPQIQSDPFVLNAANDALKVVAPVPVIVKPPTKSKSRFTVPLVVIATTAALSTGVLFLVHRRRHATASIVAGPLRRKAEAALRRRQAQQ